MNIKQLPQLNRKIPGSSRPNGMLGVLTEPRKFTLPTTNQ